MPQSKSKLNRLAPLLAGLMSFACSFDSIAADTSKPEIRVEQTAFAQTLQKKVTCKSSSFEPRRVDCFLQHDGLEAKFAAVNEKGGAVYVNAIGPNESVSIRGR